MQKETMNYYEQKDEIELDDLNETKKKLEQKEILPLFFGSKDQLVQLYEIYKVAYEKKDIKTLQVFFPNISTEKGKDINLSKYPKEVEVLNHGNVATVVDKNMFQNEKDKYRKLLEKVNKLNLFRSDNLQEFIKYADKNGVKAGVVNCEFNSKATYFYINCDIDKKLELLSGFANEQSKQNKSLLGKAEKAEKKSKNQNKDLDNGIPNKNDEENR